MMGAFLLAISLVARAASEPDDAARYMAVIDPIEASVPKSVAENWNVFDWSRLPQGNHDGPPLVIERVKPKRTGRLDIFVRRMRSWTWIGGFLYRGAENLPGLPEERVGILLRSPDASGSFFWGEADGSQENAPVTLHHFRNLAVRRPERASSLLLYVSGEESPRLASSEKPTFRMIPLAPALCCALAEEGGDCRSVNQAATAVEFQGHADFGIRVFWVEKEKTSVLVLAPGRSVIRPRVVPSELEEAGRWKGIKIPGRQNWDEIVLEWGCEDCGRTLLGGKGLPQPPAWSPLVLPEEKGLAVSAVTGPHSEPVIAEEARLTFLLDSEDALGWIPLATVAGDSQGVFRAPDLPRGRYALKLFAGTASSQKVTASLEPGVLKEVRFETGPAVHGRVILKGSAAAGETARIAVVRRVPLPSDVPSRGTEARPGEDLSDWVREVRADSTGRFRLSLTLPGPYAVRASWGHAHAEKEFLVSEMTKEIDLGDLVLSSGSTLRGIVEGCAGGEVRLTPVPQGSTVPFFDFRRAAVNTAGQFSVEGLTQGAWVLGGRCHDMDLSLDPEVIVLPSEGEVFLQFSAIAK